MFRHAFITAVLLASLLAAPLAAAPASASGTADIHVEQESHISGDVEIEERPDTTVYSVHGDRILIQPQNFNHANVTNYGIEESAGTLTWHEELGVYEFHADGDGTYHLYWDVEETQGDGNETTTTTERYSAVLDVTRSDAITVGADHYQELQTAANNWQEWKSTVQGISGASADIQVETQLAANLLNVRRNPLQALTGEFWYLGVALFGTLTGLIWVTIFGFYNWIDKRQIRKELNQKKALLPDRGELEEKLSEYDHKDDLQSMVTTRPNDWYDDPYIGQAATDVHGQDMLTHLSTFPEMISGVGALRDRLQAMAETGYRTRLKRDNDEIVDAALLDPEDSAATPDGGDTVALRDLDDADFDRVHDVVDIHDPVLKAFSYRECDADRSELREDGDIPESLDAMWQQMDAELDRFGGDKEAYGEYLEALLIDVIRNPATDANGVAKCQRVMMEQWYRVAIEGRDIFGVPIDFQLDVIQDLLADHNPVEDAQRVAIQDRDGKNPFGDEVTGDD